MIFNDNCTVTCYCHCRQLMDKFTTPDLFFILNVKMLYKMYPTCVKCVINHYCFSDYLKLRRVAGLSVMLLLLANGFAKAL